jgi:hypothetical protein
LKSNSFCAAGQQTRVLSRNQKDFGARFPEIQDAFSALNVQDAVINGEMVGLDEQGHSSFQLLQAHAMGRELGEAVDDLEAGDGALGLPLARRIVLVITGLGLDEISVPGRAK